MEMSIFFDVHPDLDLTEEDIKSLTEGFENTIGTLLNFGLFFSAINKKPELSDEEVIACMKKPTERIEWSIVCEAAMKVLLGFFEFNTAILFNQEKGTIVYLRPIDYDMSEIEKEVEEVLVEEKEIKITHSYPTTIH